MIRVPIRGNQEEEDEDEERDGYSSAGSVIRVPVDGDQEEGDADEDGYSSSGSVVRVDASEGDCRPDGSVVSAPVASNTAEDDGCSSDGCSSDSSVVRLPTDKSGVGGGVDGTTGESEGPGLERKGNDGNSVEWGGTGKVPAHAKLNLLAASKYFGPKGGGLDGEGGATAQATRNGSQSSQREHDNPQVRHVWQVV